MKDRRKRSLVRIICIILILIGMYIVCTDALFRWLCGGQYAFNISFFVLLPVLIHGTGWTDYVEKL